MNIAIRSFPGQVALCAALAAVASCSQPSPVAPAHSSSATGDAQRAGFESGGAAAVAFPLVRGSLVLANSRGDRIVGTYSGTTLISEGAIQLSSLTLEISGGSGSFADAAGTMAIQGTGAFVDEGEFVLDGRGELTRTGGRPRPVVLSLRGSSRATCSSSDQIAIIQTADGVMSHGGRVTATLTHEVGSTGCSS